MTATVSLTRTDAAGVAFRGNGITFTMPDLVPNSVVECRLDIRNLDFLPADGASMSSSASIGRGEVYLRATNTVGGAEWTRTYRNTTFPPFNNRSIGGGFDSRVFVPNMNVVLVFDNSVIPAGSSVMVDLGLFYTGGPSATATAFYQSAFINARVV